ncbi:MAG TPA: LPS export ABC transporter periplasmic protein LptC [Segetibacter sp.]|jgi:LPS export ABC transporter protein LptC
MINFRGIKINFLAAFFGGCFFICSCENDPETVKNLGKKKIGVEEAINIESLLSQEGKLKAKLTAPFMLRYQLDTPKVEFPKSIQVTFYGDQLKIESKLFAKYAIYRESENKVFLKDSIVVYNLSGDTLRTNELYWDQQREKFYTDKKVIITKPTQKLYGTGMEADQNFKKFTIFGVRNSFMTIPDSTYLGTF